MSARVAPAACWRALTPAAREVLRFLGQPGAYAFVWPSGTGLDRRVAEAASHSDHGAGRDILVAHRGADTDLAPWAVLIAAGLAVRAARTIAITEAGRLALPPAHRSPSETRP